MSKIGLVKAWQNRKILPITDCFQCKDNFNYFLREQEARIERDFILVRRKPGKGKG